jgi:hypothetical protein
MGFGSRTGRYLTSLNSEHTPSEGALSANTGMVLEVRNSSSTLIIYHTKSFHGGQQPRCSTVHGKCRVQDIIGRSDRSMDRSPQLSFTMHLGIRANFFGLLDASAIDFSGFVRRK